MSQNKQTDRPLTIDTPLGTDVVLLRGLSGREAISRLFRFELDLMADNKAVVAFDKLLGKKVTAHIPLAKSGERHFNGVCIRISQGERDPRQNTFTGYRMEIVPEAWMLTRKAQSRIFQHLSVPDILKKVFAGLDVSFELQGAFQPRDYCVQYRETDFNFAARLMEDEGIYFYFKHSKASHTMVVANTPGSHADLPGPSDLIYENVLEGTRDEDRILDWEKIQELRSGKYTLFDHCFELPHKHLEAEKQIQDTVSVGTVSHKLKVGDNSKLEIFDFPGEYAQRFDGVDKAGGDQPAELQKIFQDNKRTVEIRMQEEAAPSIRIRGSGNCRQMVAGHKFTLQRHFNADGGPYVLTEVQHEARGGDFRPGVAGSFRYSNEFVCIPLGLPFRPPRTTPRAVVPGTQTAVVVGPPGEEIFPDKNGRVKVQFHWDREGKNDLDSSCWLRVATHWAGKQWGIVHIPRIGQEVLVDFLEGDPDQPIIIGSVYNSDMMPPYELPKNKTQSGIKSRSSLKGTPANFNEFRFEDKKGSEQIFLHAERNQDIEVEADETHSVGHDRTKTIGHDETDLIKNDWSTEVKNNRTTIVRGDDHEDVTGEQFVVVHKDRFVGVEGNQTTSISRDRTETVLGSHTETIAVNRAVTIGASDSLTVGASKTETVGGSDAISVGASLSITTGGATTITAGGATMVTAGGAISITAGGAIAITAGGAVSVTAGGAIAVSASAITLSGIVMVGGILLTPLIVTGGVVSGIYTPGLGNML